MTDDARWQARFERERAARREAETLLHDKSRELYLANQALQARAAELAASMASLTAAQDAMVRQGKLAALGGLVAGVAHEINTPLGVAVTAVSLSVEQLAELDAMVASGRLSKSGVLQLLAAMRESTSLVQANLQRAAALVQSFKMVAVDQSREEPRGALLDVLLADLVASLGPLLRPAAATVELRVPEGVRVTVDAGALAQVVTNLVHNACVHAFAGVAPPHVITIEASCGDAGLTLVVADNGVGMAADVAVRAWEPFFTTRRGDGGTGLGLHIVHNVVVDRFGGRVDLHTAPGAGCRYAITLPLGTAALRREDAR